MSPSEVFIKITVFSLPPGALQARTTNKSEKVNILNNILFMNITFWLIMFCNSESKDI
jgi:hypothetical protein